jgi:hypothetical protein
MDDEVSLNAGSMILFREDASTTNCTVISCHSLFPRIVFGELFLALDEIKEQLAFVELIAGPEMPQDVIRFLLNVVMGYCADTFDNRLRYVGKPLDSLQTLLSSKSKVISNGDGMLSRVRLCYLGDRVCFMLSESMELFTQKAESADAVDTSDGRVQVLRSPKGETAIEGWCHLANERWEAFCDESQKE